MSVDLHRISTGISSGTSRNGFGNIVSFPSVVPAPFITYTDEYTGVTTTYYTTGKVYGDLIISGQIATNDGANNINPPELYGGESLRVKYNTFEVFYNGAGGYYTEIVDSGLAWPYGTNLWSNESGAYSPFGYAVFVTYIPNGGDFGNGYYLDGTQRNYLADGYGGFYVTMSANTYFADYTEIELSDDGDMVYWDGVGNYYI